LFYSLLRQSELFSKPATTIDSFVERLDGVLTGLLHGRDGSYPSTRRESKSTSINGCCLTTPQCCQTTTLATIERRCRRRTDCDVDRRQYRRELVSSRQLAHQRATKGF